MNVLIVCSGNIKDYTYYEKYLRESDFIICVDGGAEHLRKFARMPDLLLGDFDSIKKSDFEYYKQNGVTVKEFPKEKDMTDTELAIDIAIEKGCSLITIIGGLGGRFDHSLANVFLLKKMLDRGVHGKILNEQNQIEIIDRSIVLEARKQWKVTLIPLTQKVIGVSTDGLYYALDDETILFGTSLGVSNEFSKDTAKISIQEGLLLVIQSRD